MYAGVADAAVDDPETAMLLILARPMKAVGTFAV